jgi:hypothetical protein
MSIHKNKNKNSNLFSHHNKNYVCNTVIHHGLFRKIYVNQTLYLGFELGFGLSIGLGFGLSIGLGLLSMIFIQKVYTYYSA